MKTFMQGCHNPNGSEYEDDHQSCCASVNHHDDNDNNQDHFYHDDFDEDLDDYDDEYNNNDDIEDEDNDSYMNRLFHRPIVVGYSFGPKKMSTMGVVMAEASKTRLRTNMFESVLEQAQEQYQNECHEQQLLSRVENDYTLRTSNILLTKEVLSSVLGGGTVESSSSSPRSYVSGQAKLATLTVPIMMPPTSVLFSSSLDSLPTFYQHQSQQGQGYGNPQQQRNTTTNHETAMVRHVHASPPSTSSWGSTGTRTASTVASFRTMSGGGGGSGSASGTIGTYRTTTDGDSASKARPSRGDARQESSNTTRSSSSTNIRVSFVPLDPEIPLSEQHGGMDVIVHKQTEDILLLSQLAMQYPVLPQILHMSNEADMDQLVAGCAPALAETDVAAVRRVFRLCQFQKQHGCFLVDDPVSVLTLMSRADIARVLKQRLSNVTSQSGMPVRSPKFAVILSPPAAIPSNNHTSSSNKDIDENPHDILQTACKAVKDANLSFPLIIKPLTAAGTKASHAMAVVTHPSGLKQATERIPSCLVQEYANHNATLYKVYVLGDFVSVHKRRSLPDLPTGTSNIMNKDDVVTAGAVDDSPPLPAVVEFDSQRPYPRLSDFGYCSPPPCSVMMTTDDSNLVEDTKAMATAPGTAAVITTVDGKKVVTSDLIVTSDEVRPIAEALKQAFGLEIFGFDILITTTKTSTFEEKPEQPQDEEEKKIMLVVDVNYFPSYKEVPNFPALLAKYLTGRAIASRLEKTRKNLSHK